MPTVPDVKDQPEDVAAEALETLGLRVDQNEVEHHEVGKGLAVGTSPPPGTEADIGSVVTLDVSIGPGRTGPFVKTVVPSLEGKSERDALEALAAANLRVGVQSRVQHDAVPAGNVITSAPAGGTEVDVGSTVALDTSSGPPPRPDAVEPEASGAAAGATDRRANGVTTGTAPVVQALQQGSASSREADKKVGVHSSVQPELSGGRTTTSSPPAVGLVAVPDLFGMTTTRSRRVLSEFGLKFSSVAHKFSDEAPRGAVLSSFPPAGQLVSQGSLVSVDISDGPESGWAQYVVPGLLAVSGLVVVGAILVALFNDDLQLLNRLADRSVARGLITFLIAVSTVGIALILSVSTVVSSPTPDDDRRFDRAKQVLTILIGVLGTIVGFYFGSTSSEDGPSASLEVEMPPAIVGQAYTPPDPLIRSVTPPVRWSIEPALPADLVLDPDTGAISGIPKAASAAKVYKVMAIDSASPPHTLEDSVSFEVRP